MYNAQIKNDNQDQVKASLRGEAPQEHGVKGKSKKQKRVNPETVAARQALIAMSQEAQAMMEMGAEVEGFEECEKVNDFLLVMHQQATGCTEFKTFQEWKKLGFSVKKGSKAYRVWGAPRKAQEEQEADAEKDAEQTFKFWPMCSLFNESQVEPNGDKPEPTPPETTDKTEKKEAVENGESEQQYTQDMGNNESLTRGLFPQAGGDFLAMTFSESKTFKTRAGAERWLAVRGLDASGRSIEEQAEEEAETGETSPFVTANYQEEQEARKDRMLERSDKAGAASIETYNRAKDMASVIPFGQPILVGHHSEKRDRKYRDKIHNTFGKAFELDGKAQHYQNKAAAVGTGGIASNDPEAVTKLKAKLAGLEKSQETMKAVNKIVRSKKLSGAEKVAEIEAAGLLTAAQAEEILKPDHCNRVGFASYSLSNNSAEIRRVKSRLADLERLRNSTPLEFENDNFSLCVDDGRVCFEFSGGKPSDEVRQLLRGAAFKWSRFKSAWVRKATANATAEAGRLLERLKTVEAIY